MPPLSQPKPSGLLGGECCIGADGKETGRAIDLFLRKTYYRGKPIAQMPKRFVEAVYIPI